MLDEARAFFSSATRLTCTTRDIIDRFVVARLETRLCIQLDQLNAEPKRTEGHPVIALGILDHVGVDGVVFVRSLFGMENMAMVLPAIARAARHNRSCRLVTDGRIACAKFRHAIVNAILAVHVENVRSPDALGLGRVGVGPLRNAAHGRLVVLPGVGIFRCPQLQIVVRAHEGVAILKANHARVVTRLQIVLRVPIGREGCGGPQRHRKTQNTTKSHTHIILPDGIYLIYLFFFQKSIKIFIKSLHFQYITTHFCNFFKIKQIKSLHFAQ